VGIGRTTERDEPNQCTLYVYMDMLQWTPQYNYYIVIKTVKNKIK
jgi:hypothetical protein